MQTSVLTLALLVGPAPAQCPGGVCPPGVQFAATRAFAAPPSNSPCACGPNCPCAAKGAAVYGDAGSSCASCGANGGEGESQAARKVRPLRRVLGLFFRPFARRGGCG